MNLKPERQAEYDELWLPFDGSQILFPSEEQLEFICKAANEYHHLLQTVETLRDNIDEIRAVACGEHGIFDDAEEALKLILEMTKEALK
jgi:hypothetical protein